MKLLKKTGNPVFVHSLWRCSNTYFLEKFKGSDSALVFTEPFNDQLSIVGANSGGLSPELAVYADLIGPRGKTGDCGVANYDIRFALNYWFDGKDHGQLHYLQGLLDLARERDKEPVLGFTRSLGRLSHLRELGGFHIVLIRDPFDVFWSNYQQLRDADTAYFTMQYVMLATLSRTVPALEALALKHHLPKLKIKGAHESFTEAYNQISRNFADNLDLLRESFILVYLLSYGAAMQHTDLVVSMDRLSRDHLYQERISGLIADRTGYELDFTDCACPQHDAPKERAEFYETFRAEQCTLEDSTHPGWVHGGRLVDSFLV
ncbi:hypothetical protein [Cerasicoccus fimbriatus]|uniref:hypothetical protein n=1 Tax=Cerasicoccus fimbriatus TaxID=3014554 RepID=UPI0022B2C1E2|nr:hypothetical protein [Cerasicoccus sp. TK19100]